VYEIHINKFGYDDSLHFAGLRGRAFPGSDFAGACPFSFGVSNIQNEAGKASNSSGAVTK
jgi:hypothetical protein